MGWVQASMATKHSFSHQFGIKIGFCPIWKYENHPHQSLTIKSEDTGIKMVDLMVVIRLDQKIVLSSCIRSEKIHCCFLKMVHCFASHFCNASPNDAFKKSPKTVNTIKYVFIK